MSVVFIVAPAVAIGWPILCSTVAGVAGALGYTVLASNKSVVVPEQRAGVEVDIEGSEIIADSMKRESEFAITNHDVTAVFKRSIDGRCTVHVSGENKTDEQLRAIGQEILNKITQQYAYNKVVTELKKQGFSVTDEEITKDNAVRIRVRKFV
jgi:uncharacterized protein YqfB (UPF0267 family)